MQSAAGHTIELTDKDIEAYWRGRAYIAAAQIGYNSQEVKSVESLTYQTIEPYLSQGWDIIKAEREQHVGALPDAVFEEGQTLEARFVVLLALMLDSERGPITGKTIVSMADLSASARDKKIVLVLNCHDTELARRLAEESGFEVRKSGVISMVEVSAKTILHNTQTGFFELDTIRERKQPDPNLNAVRNKHNHVGRTFSNQRLSAKPKRQNFKGRGR